MKKRNVTLSYILKIMNKKTLFGPTDPIFFIQKNYDQLILEGTSQNNFTDILTYLFKFSEFKDLLDQKFEQNMGKVDGGSIDLVLHLYLTGKNEEERNAFLEKRLPKVVEEISGDKLSYYLDYKYIGSIREILNEKIKCYKKDFLKYILFGMNGVSFSDELLFVIEKLIQEILDSEKLDFIDIDYLRSGSYSRVFGIGSKVLKVGRERKTYNIPYDKRILQPLIRINLGDLSLNDSGVIEVVEKVDTDIAVCYDDLYFIYKELRDRGIVWTDIKHNNVGRLLKDNKRYWDKPLGGDMQALGYIDEGLLNDDVLKAGEFVIIDSDYIYYEKDLDNVSSGNPLWREIERQYQWEKEYDIICSKESSDDDLKDNSHRRK